MERFKDLIETSSWFILMGLLTIIKDGMKSNGKWDYKRALSKFFINVITGVGFYSFILSYKPWYGEYPQKIWVIMLVVYAGSSLIDIIVDKIADGIKKFDFKELIKMIFKL